MSQNSQFEIDDAARTLNCNPREHAFNQNPYTLYSQMHQSNKTLFWQDYGHWCFAGCGDVNALLRDKRFGRQILHVTTREKLGWPEPLAHTRAFDHAEKYSLLALEPPAHTRLRLLVNRAFVSRQVEQLRPQITKLSHDLIDGIIDQGSVDLLTEFATPIPILIITQMLDIPAEMGPQLLDWSHNMVAMYMFGRSREDEDIATQAAVDFRDYLRKLIAERRKSPGEDLLSHMILTEAKGERLSEDELISTTILLLNAGHEATVHQTGNAVKSILESGLDPKSLFSSDQQTAATIEECLRFSAPLHMFTRYALSDIELDGNIKLKTGDEIGLLLAAANHDPTRFDTPSQFDPFRKNNANVTFGAGIHFCIGAPLARLEMQVGLSVLFERLPNLKLAENPVFRSAYHFHGLEKLQVSW